MLEQSIGRRRKRKYSLPAAAVFIAISLAGCTAKDGTPRMDPGVTMPMRPLPSMAALNNPPLPLQQYMLMGKDRETVEKAENILIEKCMSAAGVPITMPQPIPETGPGVDLRYRRYGVQDLESAKMFGYRYQFDTPAVIAARTAAGTFDHAVTPRQTEALTGQNVNGTPSRMTRGGCLGYADRAVAAGTGLKDFQLIDQDPWVRRINMSKEATSSANTSRAMQNFANCMERFGFKGMSDPRMVPAQFRNRDTLEGDEVSAAVNQFECQEKSNVTTLMQETEALFQEREIRKSIQHFTDLKKDMLIVLSNAREIVRNR